MPNNGRRTVLKNLTESLPPRHHILLRQLTLDTLESSVQVIGKTYHEIRLHATKTEAAP